MANEIFKEIKTRIALRTGDYNYWTTGAGKDIELRKGEVCVCTIETADNQATNAPTVLFKVADANGKKFADLKWSSALAADVYNWAKNEGGKVFTKDGVGNVISGIVYDATLNEGKGGFKYTTASVATSEGLAALQKDINDSREAWALDTDTRYTFANDGDKLVVKKTLYTNGVAGKEEDVGTYEFLSETEVKTILNDYYKKTEVDDLLEDYYTKDDVDGIVEGLGDAAYATVANLNATAKGYADAVLGNNGDAATANTVYGAKAAAAAAQSDATIAKTKIETFLGTITPDGSQDIIDTLAEINKYVGDHGKEFSNLSSKVTDITKDNGDIDNKIAAYDATLGTLAKKNTITHDLVDDFDNAVKSVKVDAAVDTDKLGGAAAADYLKKADAVGYKDILTKTEAPNLYQAKGEYASKVQGEKAESALQEVEVGDGLKVSTKQNNKQKIEINDEVIFFLDCNW